MKTEDDQISVWTQTNAISPLRRAAKRTMT